MDGRTTEPSHPISSPGAFGSGELKKTGKKRELNTLGLDSNSSKSSSSCSSDSSESSFEESESSVSKKQKKKLKHSQKKKSGINAKASDKVKFPQRWPHAHLQFEHVNEQVKFDELDFNSLNTKKHATKFSSANFQKMSKL